MHLARACEIDGSRDHDGSGDEFVTRVE